MDYCTKFITTYLASAASMSLSLRLVEMAGTTRPASVLYSPSWLPLFLFLLRVICRYWAGIVVKTFWSFLKKWRRISDALKAEDWNWGQVWPLTHFFSFLLVKNPWFAWRANQWPRVREILFSSVPCPATCSSQTPSKTSGKNLDCENKKKAKNH